MWEVSASYKVKESEWKNGGNKSNFPFEGLVRLIEVPLQTLDEILGGSFPTTKHSGGRYQ